MENKNNNVKNVKTKNSKIKIVILVLLGIIISAAVGAGSLLLVLKMNPDWATQKITNVTKTEKEVTVTDQGIAEAVDKLYDATVIVKVGSTKDSYEGHGSGFVYKTDGNYAYVLTNAHVVEDAKYVSVVNTDNKEVSGEIIGYDEYSDVGVVKVPISIVKSVATIGNSDDVRLGDTVFAIGTPLSINYAFTVTRGILSGKDRLTTMSSSNSYGQTSDVWYLSLLQIDASINSGNSGGPLANSNGEVIGITNSKLSGSTGTSANIENMGFAIPIEVAVNVAEQLMSDGKITRPVLGVTMTTIEQAAQQGIRLSDDITSGAVVVDVSADSCADKAGLKKGDVITKLGDNDIENYMYLKYYLYTYKVGDKVSITYIRDGKEHTTEVKLSN